MVAIQTKNNGMKDVRSREEEDSEKGSGRNEKGRNNNRRFRGK
jgi:hypothetical protein